MDSVAEWLDTGSWHQSIAVHAVGSILDGRLVDDLDLVLTPKAGALVPWIEVAYAMASLRAFGLYQLKIKIDSSFHREPYDSIVCKAHDGEIFEAWKLRSPYWNDRLKRGEYGLFPAGPNLIRLMRRLDQTNYYYKLPLGVWRGRTQRVWRTAQLLSP